MATHRITRILAGGFAVAALVGPAVATTLTAVGGSSLAACPSGETEDVYTNVCTPDLAPNNPFSASPANPDVPTIGGIPCIGRSSASCVGLAEEQEAQGPQPVPRSSVSSSP